MMEVDPEEDSGKCRIGFALRQFELDRSERPSESVSLGFGTLQVVEEVLSSGEPLLMG